MVKVGIIGVGQSSFVRQYPGSIRELAFEGFKAAVLDAQITTKDIGASVICSAPEYDKQRSDSIPSPLFTWKACVPPAAWGCAWPIPWSGPGCMTWWQ